MPSRATTRPRLGLLASHPIQYLSPLLRELAQHYDLRVFYGHQQSAEDQAAAGYGVAFDWDTDLLNGYQFEFLRNVAPSPSVGRFDGVDCPELSEIVSRERFDVFVVGGWYLLAYMQAVAACRLRGVPVLVRGDSQLHTPRSPLMWAAKEVVTRVLLAQFDAFLSVGRRNHAYLEHYGVAPHRIFPAPHFVDNAFFRERSRTSQAEHVQLRAELGAEPGDTVALFVGRLVESKRPLDLVRAASQLRDTLPRLRLAFVGAGGLEADLRALAVDLGVRISLTGFRNQTELPPVYGAADMLVLPSDGRETWGLVVNEAFACGLPAVVSDAVGCGPDLVQEGKTGAVFPCGDVTALARAIERVAALARSPQLQRQLAEASDRHSCAAATAGTLAAVDHVTGYARAGRS